MADLLSIAGTALRNNQSALAVVSNNIANVDTDGYVRQELDVRENQPSKSGQVYIGSGAVATGTKRAYDALVESSLRASKSDLAAQPPLIELTNRLIDVLGSDKASLTPALNDFFGGIKDLSQDPSSQSRRGQALSAAENLVSRFNDLGNQFELLDDESKNRIDYELSRFNSLTEQLLIVNQRLGRQPEIKRQPPDLLNLRDKLLIDMSEIIRISVTETANGTVMVGLGSSSGAEPLLDSHGKVDIGVSYQMDQSPSSALLVKDPYGTTEPISGILGGSLGGLIQFRDSMLGPSWQSLDRVASTMANEVNSILSGGMDLDGEKGEPLFKVPLRFNSDLSMARANIGIDITLVAESEHNGNPLELIYDGTNGRWLVTDQVSGMRYSSQSPSGLIVNGLRISFSGEPQDGDVVRVNSVASPARSIELGFSDSKKIAAADLFGVTNGLSNTSLARASVSANLDTINRGETSLAEVLDNNLNSSSALRVQSSFTESLFSVPAGISNAIIEMEQVGTSNIELQVFTKEGRQIFGSADLTQEQKSVMLSAQNGFSENLTYSDTYRNSPSDYLNSDWTVGAFDKSITSINESGEGYLVKEAAIGSVALQEFNSDGSGVVIPENALRLNGYSLSEFSIAANARLTSTAIVSWLNDNIQAAGLGLIASSNEYIEIPAAEVNLNGTSLSINGRAINLSGDIPDISSLVERINRVSASSGVDARFDVNQGLVLSNRAAVAGQAISISGSDDMFTEFNGDMYTGVTVTVDPRSRVDLSEKEVALTLDSSGSSAHLSAIGFNTSLYLPGVLEEDLIVFATGSAGHSADVFAEYAREERPLLVERDRETRVRFVTESTYEIVDTASNTVLAERNFVPGDKINFGSFTIAFSEKPSAGDEFVVDGNQTGLGSNGNLLRLASLEGAQVLGDETMFEGYLSILSNAGNVSQKASVAKDALEVVYEQANKAKDQKAGVNLDEEAANLIRYQQAYQASARVMQTANQLFDVLLRI